MVVGLVDLLEVIQIPLGHQQQDIQDKPGALLGAHVPHHAALQIAHHRGLLQADGDDVLIRDNDAHGQGGVDHAGLVLLHGGGVHDNEGGAVLLVDAGGLLLVQGRPEEGGLHRQGGGHGFQLVLAGVDEVHPAAVGDGAELGHFALHGLVDGHHTRSHLSRRGGKG